MAKELKPLRKYNKRYIIKVPTEDIIISGGFVDTKASAYEGNPKFEDIADSYFETIYEKLHKHGNDVEEAIDVLRISGCDMETVENALDKAYRAINRDVLWHMAKLELKNEIRMESHQAILLDERERGLFPKDDLDREHKIRGVEFVNVGDEETTIVVCEDLAIFESMGDHSGMENAVRGEGFRRAIIKERFGADGFYIAEGGARERVKPMNVAYEINKAKVEADELIIDELKKAGCKVGDPDYIKKTGKWEYIPFGRRKHYEE